MERTYGIELEILIPEGKPSGYTLENHFDGWRFHHDDSIQMISEKGYYNYSELVSPILSGPSGFLSIGSTCSKLYKWDVISNKSCGLHVHVGARDLKKEQKSKLARFWVMNQDLIHTMFPDHRVNNQYCKPVLFVDLLQYDKTGSWDRYKAFNLAAIEKHGTIEFRIHRGSIDSRKINAWVKFCLAFVNAYNKEGVVKDYSSLSDLFSAIGLDKKAASFLLFQAKKHTALKEKYKKVKAERAKNSYLCQCPGCVLVRSYRNNY